ncbi:hypothetical protein X975_01633, partial [Stegodyphus mimosarum]
MKLVALKGPPISGTAQNSTFLEKQYIHIYFFCKKNKVSQRFPDPVHP